MYNFVAKLDGRQYIRRMCYNMAGTGAQWNTWNDPTHVVTNAIDGKYYARQGVWYPAEPFPMNDSVEIGLAEHLRLLDAKSPEMHWVGIYYSQSGIVAHKLYEMTRPGMEYERHGETLDAMIIFGPPCREKNVANGNRYANWPMPEDDSRGISDERFSDTPSYVYDFVSPPTSELPDIYGEVPDNDVGEDMTMIFRIVQDPKAFLIGQDSAIQQISELMISPLREIPAAIMAIYNAIRFFTSSPWPTYPHTSYDCGPAINLLNQIALEVPVGESVSL